MSKDLDTQTRIILDSLTWEEFKEWNNFLMYDKNILDGTGVPSNILEVASKLIKLEKKYGKAKIK